MLCAIVRLANWCDRFRHSIQFLLIVVVILTGAGCATDRLVQLRSEPYNPMAERLRLYARGGPKASERTMRLLRQYDLAENRIRKPQTVLTQLRKVHDDNPTAESCYALAELSYIGGKKLEIIDRRQAAEFYWKAVIQCYTYLFDPTLNIDRNPYDPQFRGACNLYNSALESCLRIAQDDGVFKPGHKVSFAVGGHQIEIAVVSKGFDWEVKDFDQFKFVSDYDVNGLKNIYRTFGLGVPLIAVRHRGTEPAEVERHYASGLSFPVTAFLRLDSIDRNDANRSVFHLELHDPLETTEINVAGRRIPLETDLSTPLAYFLDNPALRHLDTFGLLRPDKVGQIAGVYMLQPYQPSKIPVLMIHGLWSSPMTWMEMFNDLQARPEIRENYQFWFYLHPTGQPFWETAAQLRKDLDEIRTVFASQDPQPAFDEMVLVGHSMGGLIAHLMTLNSGNDFWNSVSDKPFELVKASPEAKQDLRQVFFFEADPSVQRVVTIASPFQGSDYANSVTKWLGKRFITLPQRTVKVTQQLLTLNPHLFRKNRSPLGSTSLDSLSPNSPILQVMHRAKNPLRVKYHNIVGVTKDLPLAENTDGVVPFSSAHREDVESEIVVEAEHSQVHRHPRTVLEIRRILIEHLNQLDSHSNSIIIPAFGHSFGNEDQFPPSLPENFTPVPPVPVNSWPR